MGRRVYLADVAAAVGGPFQRPFLMFGMAKVRAMG